MRLKTLPSPKLYFQNARNPGRTLLGFSLKIKSLDKASFATSIVRVLFHSLFHVDNMFRT
jgi:hypothetical protein